MPSRFNAVNCSPNKQTSTPSIITTCARLTTDTFDGAPMVKALVKQIWPIVAATLVGRRMLDSCRFGLKNFVHSSVQEGFRSRLCSTWY